MNTTINLTGNKPQVRNNTFDSLKVFLVVWIGQVVSILGSGMTGFALGVWIFQQTGSATSFALTLLFNMLPKALVAPLAGVVADRYDRRKIMMLTDLIAGLATMSVAGLFLAGQLTLWHIYLLVAVNASASALQGPAFGAAVTQLVPKNQYGRANGLLQLGEGLGQIMAPVLAGILIAIYGLASVVLFDMLTFLFAVTTLQLIRFPPVPGSEQVDNESPASWTSQLGQAAHYLRVRPGLLGLLLVFSLVNFFVGGAEAVLTPMVLSFTTPEKLGLIMTTGGVGMLLGSMLVSVLGNTPHKVYAVFGAYALLGGAVVLAGLQPSVTLVAVAVFLAFFFLPTVMGSSQAILQAKVAPKIQGRVFGLRIFLNTISFAVAYLVGGTLADRFFEPWMGEGGWLANTFGPLIGAGPGRGMGLMFVMMGILAILTALVAFAFPRIRRVESELPDAITD